MAKEFYTERDIEDMVKRGVNSLTLSENVVLTELAFEKAQKLGMQLLRDRLLHPPAAPIRPYLSQERTLDVAESNNHTVTPDLAVRIKDAVNARMGTQVDQQLLDVIIQRVLKSTGMK